MHYYGIFLEGVREIYTWEFLEDLPLGTRVKVNFRNRQKIGIVVSESLRKPEFETQKITEILEKEFIPGTYIKLAKFISEQNFCSINKVLSLMVPEEFLQKENPEKREVFYTIAKTLQSKTPSGSPLTGGEKTVKGKKQQEVLNVLVENSGKIVEKKLLEIASRATINSLLEKKIIEKKFGVLESPVELNQIREVKNHPLTKTQQEIFEKILDSEKPFLLWGVTGSGKTEIYKKLAEQFVGANIIRPPEKTTSNSPLSGGGFGGQILFLVPEISLTPQLIGEFKSIFGEKVAVWHSKLSRGEKVQEWARIKSGEAQILIGARSAVLVPIPNLKLIIVDEEHEWTYKNEFIPRFWTHEVVEWLFDCNEQLTINNKQLGIKNDVNSQNTKYKIQDTSIKLVFGSATPRLESWEKVQAGEWEMGHLPERILQKNLPEIELVDLKNEGRKGNYSSLSEKLLAELGNILKNKRQAVLFLNKRGFAGATLCRFCGHTFHCPNCSANMKAHFRVGSREWGVGSKRNYNEVHHNSDGKLICHICGHMENFPKVCPECDHADFQFKGWGTQQVEIFLQEKFPHARILRMDRDSVTGKHGFEDSLKKFYNHEADILLGTQMIAKGLDFEKVDLVGVILADIGLNLPDFRSEERVFQLLTQVAGRAGRRETRGKIIIQTFNPEEKIFEFVARHNVEGFLNWQKIERQKSFIPPFSSIAKITFADFKKEKAFIEARNFYHLVKEKIESQMGEYMDSPLQGEIPNSKSQNTKYKIQDTKITTNDQPPTTNCFWAPAFFPKLHGKYHFHVILKMGKKEDLINFLKNIEVPSIAKIDLNPVSLL